MRWIALERWFAIGLALGVALILGSCATMAWRDPPEVTVAGVEPLASEGLEARMLVKLRVRNPNDAPLAYDGVSLKLDLLGKTFASGVTDAHGTIPRFGESVVPIPVTVSAVTVATQLLKWVERGDPQHVDYVLEGKLGAPGMGSTRFRSQGEIALPGFQVR